MRTEDGNIIQECLNGKPQAFGMLVDKYKEGVYAFVYAELGDFQDAQDVTQEVFLQAYRDLRSLRRWESFVFWLYRIARRRCIQWFRVSSRRVDREYIEDQGTEVMDAHSLDSYRDSQLSESLGEALDSLPEIHREVLLLHYFGGMNSKEIASAIGTSPGAVRVRLTRARAQLREEMAAMMDTAFEAQKIPAGFTLRIVEAVRRMKIHPMPRMAGLPWGLSLAAGIIITVLSLNPQMSIPIDTAIPTGSPLPVEAKVLKTGEIPVDILETSQISVITSKQGDGDGGRPNPQNAFMFAPQQDEGGSWAQKADMPTARHMLSTCALDGKVYAIGGCTAGGQIFSAVEVYDPKADTWTKKAGMLTARLLDNAASVVNGKIYAIGGWDGTEQLKTVEEYNPATDTWTKKAGMPTARCHMSTCAVNGKIYAIGGCINSDLFTSVVEEYDPETDTWTKKADMPTVRAALDAAAVNGKIYAIGGKTPPWGGGQNLSTVEEYNPATDTWTRKADMPNPRARLAVCALGEKIYAISGHGRRPDGKGPPFTGATELVEEYDPATDTWTRKADIPTRRQHPSACAVNGRIYTIGGGLTNPQTTYSIVEEYTPGDWRPEAVSPQGKIPTKWGEVKSD